MRIDAHQHFWKLDRGDYAWLSKEYECLYKDYQPEDLAPVLGKEGIDKTVVVQAADTVAESKYLLELADQHSFIAGVVGWVDMEGSTAIEDLEHLACHSALLGIRPMIQDIADVDWMCRPVLDPAYEALIERQLTFDALVREEHLANLLKVMNQHSDLRIVVDHGGKPDIESGAYRNWAELMQEISAHPQAYCKLSGLLTEAGHRNTREDLQPYVDHMLECFGPERLMWGSDWPVVRLADEYEGWLTMTDRLLAGLDQAGQQEIMGGSAARFYQLNVNNQE